MSRRLPATPVEALDLSTRTLRVKSAAAVKLAELFGYWKSPYKQAATDFAEMTMSDIYYWIYKCRNPVARTEDGRTPGDVFQTDLSRVVLPKDFEGQSKATLSAAGDILQAEGLENSKDVLYESVSDLLFDRTITYANFESPVTTQPLVKEVISDREAPTECCSAEQFEVLTAHHGKRFNLLNAANNHTIDMGIEGIETTLSTFAKTGTVDVGLNGSPDTYGDARILERDGIKFGFATATFGLNGRTLDPAEEHRVYVAKLLSKFAPPDLDLVKKQIDHCKQEGCDFIIASLHWGFEFEFFPRNRQIEAARELVEYGADSIICHHVHVVQPVEYYRTKRDPDRVAVIAYSLGSLIWGYTAPHLALSAILDLTLAKGKYKGRDVTYLAQAHVTPVFRSSLDVGGKIVTRIEKLAAHLDDRRNDHPGSYIRKMEAYADLVLRHYSKDSGSSRRDLAERA